MVSYWLLLAGSFSAYLFWNSARFNDIRIIFITGIMSFFILVCYVFFIRLYGFVSPDMLTYHNQYYSDTITFWHLKEYFFWLIYRSPNKILPVEEFMIVLDFFGLSIFYFSYRLIGLRKIQSFAAAILTFYFFPFDFGRHNVYRQYLAETIGIWSFSYLISKVTNSKNTVISTAFIYIPALFHNGALVYLVNTLLVNLKGKKLIAFLVINLFFLIVAYFSIGAEGAHLLEEKLSRERAGSGTFSTELLYIVLIIISLYFSRSILKSMFGNNYKMWAIFVNISIITIYLLATSTYAERSGMYILSIIFPLLVLTSSRKNLVFSIFFFVIYFIPLLFPATMIVVSGENLWNLN